MNKHFNPAISEEKFAAWLDGMLQQDEMDEVGALIGNDSDMQSVLASANMLEDSLLYSDNYLQLDLLSSPSPLVDFELPELNLPTNIHDALSNQTNLTMDFLPDSGFDLQPTAETHIDDSPMTGMEQDMNDMNL